MKFEQLSDWIIVDDYCATRIKIGGDPNKVEDRVAFIDKAPRVRISNYCVEEKHEDGWVSCKIQKNDAWLYAKNRGSSEYGHDKENREWCDQMLMLLGWK